MLAWLALSRDESHLPLTFIASGRAQQTAWLLRHWSKVAEARHPGISLILLGDSITQGYERPGYRDISHQYFPGALNLGFNGDRTGAALWRIQHGELGRAEASEVVLLIGTNDLNVPAPSAASTATGIVNLIEALHTRMPAARILVLAILPSGYGELRETEAAATNLAVQHWTQTHPYTHWLDASSIFLDGTRLRQDLFIDPAEGRPSLHPTPEGQQQLAALTRRTLDAWREAEQHHQP